MIDWVAVRMIDNTLMPKKVGVGSAVFFNQTVLEAFSFCDQLRWLVICQLRKTSGNSEVSFTAWVSLSEATESPLLWDHTEVSRLVYILWYGRVHIQWVRPWSFQLSELKFYATRWPPEHISNGCFLHMLQSAPNLTLAYEWALNTEQTVHRRQTRACIRYKS